jgi:phenylacetate-CoA ligase
MGYRAKRLQDFARGVREQGARGALALAARAAGALPKGALRGVARYAAERSPFWRERLGGGPVELTALPVLTKAELMEHFDDLVTDRRLRLDELLEHLARVDRDTLLLGEYRVMTSSGSSGREAAFVYDRAGWRGILTMFLRRSNWVGLTPRLPRRRLAMIGGGAPTHMSRRGAQSLDVGVHRLLSLAVTQPLDELVAALNESSRTS